MCITHGRSPFCIHSCFSSNIILPRMFTCKTAWLGVHKWCFAQHRLRTIDLDPRHTGHPARWQTQQPQSVSRGVLEQGQELPTMHVPPVVGPLPGPSALPASCSGTAARPARFERGRPATVPRVLGKRERGNPWFSVRMGGGGVVCGRCAVACVTGCDVRVNSQRPQGKAPVRRLCHPCYRYWCGKLLSCHASHTP